MLIWKNGTMFINNLLSHLVRNTSCESYDQTFFTWAACRNFEENFFRLNNGITCKPFSTFFLLLMFHTWVSLPDLQVIPSLWFFFQETCFGSLIIFCDVSFLLSRDNANWILHSWCLNRQSHLVLLRLLLWQLIINITLIISWYLDSRSCLL